MRGLLVCIVIAFAQVLLFSSSVEAVCRIQCDSPTFQSETSGEQVCACNPGDVAPTFFSDVQSCNFDVIMTPRAPDTQALVSEFVDFCSSRGCQCEDSSTSAIFLNTDVAQTENAMLTNEVITDPVVSTCPHQDSALTLFSSNTAWNQNGADVVIAASDKVLLNTISADIILNSISVFGTLVINDADMNINVKRIRVEKGGFLKMGSESCRINNKVIITFHGARDGVANDLGFDPNDGGKLGTKGIAVVSGASLEVWGNVRYPTWTRLIKPAPKGAVTLTLEKPVEWIAGDRIVIASTDFGPMFPTTHPGLTPSVNWIKGSYMFPEQSEDRIIASVSEDKMTITLTQPLAWTHWASSQFSDIRAEVGLLTRNVVLRGDSSSDASTFGGHIMIRDAEKAELNGIEITRMAQRGVMGRYPVHFHLMGADKTGKAFLRDSSIYANYQRCVTIHDSRGVVISGNVAYNNFGHCYFLEDGAETNNVFDRNLGVLVQPVPSELIVAGTTDVKAQLIPTDNEPSIFWITNADNTVTNNAAVGGKFAYWLAFPRKPTGLSATKYAADNSMKPRNSVMKKFADNVAHSTMEDCLMIDFMETPIGTTEQGFYEPIHPVTGAKVVAEFEGFVAYKCRANAVWTRGSPHRFSNMRIYDTLKGIDQIPSGSVIVEHSLIVGESDNLGTGVATRETVDGVLRSRPYRWSPTATIKGFEHYDNGGEQLSRNVTFMNFVSTASRKAGAVAALDGRYILQTRNKMSQSRFINSNRIYLPLNIKNDNEYGMFFQDIDGTTTGVRGHTLVVANNTFMSQPDCIQRREANALICKPIFGGYSQLYIVDATHPNGDYVGTDGVDRKTTWINQDNKFIRATFHRINSPSRNIPAKIDVIGAINVGFQYMMNVQTRNAYTIRWAHGTPTPNKLQVSMNSASHRDWVLVAIPYPPSALPFTVTSTRWGFPQITVQQTTTFADLLKYGGNTLYFWDATTNHLWLRVENTKNNLREDWQHSDYDTDGLLFTIIASCTRCVLTTPAIPSLSAVIETHEKYFATLNTCQQDAAVRSESKPALGQGVVLAGFDKNTKSLRLEVYHDLSATVTAVTVGTRSRSIPVNMPKYSPSKLEFTLSWLEWAALARGELFVDVKTTNNKDGELRGFIGCNQATCTLPPAIIGATPCTLASTEFISVYDDAVPGWPNWHSWSWSNNGVPTSFDPLNTEHVLCGTKSLKVTTHKGAFALGRVLNNVNTKNPSIDTAIYKYFEFHIRSTNSTGRINNMQLRFLDAANKEFIVPSFDKYINTYVMDDAMWSKVKIPLIDLKFPSAVVSIQRIDWSILWWADVKTSDREHTFYLDNIRFTKEYVDATRASPATAVVKYAEKCKDLYQDYPLLAPTFTITKSTSASGTLVAVNIPQFRNVESIIAKWTDTAARTVTLMPTSTVGLFTATSPVAVNAGARVSFVVSAMTGGTFTSTITW